MLSFQLSDYAGEYPIVAINVIGIELYRIAPAMLRIDRFVPASANTEIGALRYKVDQLRVSLFQLL